MASQYAEIEANFVAKAQAGDRDAFGELVRHHHQGVVNVVYRMCGDVLLAEDAAQDAFIQVWLHLPSFQPGTSLRNWIYRIAVNSALDVLRRESRASEVDLETLSLHEPSTSLESGVLDKERAVVVQRAIRSLPEASRSVLILREYGGLSYQEIADSLNIPVGTVMSRLSYARERLKELLVPQISLLEPANG